MAEGSRGILSLAIKDKGSLYAAYIPFVKKPNDFPSQVTLYGLLHLTRKAIALQALVFSLVNKIMAKLEIK